MGTEDTNFGGNAMYRPILSFSFKWGPVIGILIALAGGFHLMDLPSLLPH